MSLNTAGFEDYGLGYPWKVPDGERHPDHVDENNDDHTCACPSCWDYMRSRPDRAWDWADG
jgi:hypothetical protein